MSVALTDIVESESQLLIDVGCRPGLYGHFSAICESMLPLKRLLELFTLSPRAEDEVVAAAASAVLFSVNCVAADAIQLGLPCTWT